MSVMRKFKGNLEEVFKHLFENQDEFAELFDYVVEQVVDPEDQLFGYEVKNPENAVQEFMEHYKENGYEKFFDTIDKTWKDHHVTSYSFVATDDLPKLIKIMQSAAGDQHIDGDGFNDENAEAYFLQFDGEQLFHNDCRALNCNLSFKSAENALDEMMTKENLEMIFADLLECIEDDGEACEFFECQILKSDIESDNVINRIIEYFKSREDKNEFFRALDKTWIDRNVSGYALVKRTDVIRFLQIVAIASNECISFWPQLYSDL
jgi:hypothetical protein